MPDLLTDIWDRILRIVQADQAGHWRQWFEQLEPLGLEAGILRIGVAERSWMEYLRRSCHDSFVQAARQVTGHLISVEYVLTDGDGQTYDAQNLDKANADDFDGIILNPDYTFDSFVSGPSNRLSHAACLAVGEAPGRVYNPLFIHGDVGLGKTHLLQATCQTVLKRAGNPKVVYLSCETFVNHFIRAVEKGDLYDFRNRYRHADVLVIDDIQFLAERERTQEEFFHTFNTLYQNRKQIILSADCSPAQMPNFEDRLVSRFNQGLVTGIDPPGYETRVAIVCKKAALRGINPPEEVIDFIAKRIDSNIRELEGALTRVHGLAMLEGGAITLDLARRAFGETVESGSPTVTISRIIEAITDHFGVRVSDLQGKRRSRSIAFPRQVCMYLARDLTRHSLEEIGGYFGGRDHTTVLHAYRTIDKLCDNDEQTRQTVEKLLTSLTARP